MIKYLIFILAFAFTGSASAITFNSTKIGPSRVFTAPPGVGTVHTTTPLVETAVQALSSFRAPFNPINFAGMVGSVIAIHVIEDGLNALRAQVGVNNTSFPAPDGWSNSMSPPTTAVLAQKWSGAAGNVYDSPQAACLSRNASAVAVFVSSSVYDCQVNGSSVAATSLSSSCPSGYTQSGGACNLTNPGLVKWPSDGQPTYYQTPAGTFALHPNDPDTASQPVFPNSRSGTDQFGNPVNETMTPNAIGGVDIVRREESVNSQTGQPITHETKIITNDLGVVTNVFSTDFNSTLNNVSSSSIVTNNNSQNIDVSSLNKESTQLEIKQLLNPDTAPDLSTFGNAEKQKYDDAIVDVQSSSTDLDNNPAAQLHLPQYWTFASGTCFPAEFNAGNFGKLSLSSFCQIYDDHIRGLIVFMLAVWSVLHIFGYWSEIVKEI
ncbi:MAG: hypothetical protein KGZ69_14835 [Methylomonas sp.]|nr:hypothetical protein [Methylomonas sp.]